MTGVRHRNLSPQRRGKIIGVVKVLAGGVAGFTVGAAIYLVLNPVLETAGRLEELQGLLWNVVPLLTAAGAIIGWRARS